VMRDPVTTSSSRGAGDPGRVGAGVGSGVELGSGVEVGADGACAEVELDAVVELVPVPVFGGSAAPARTAPTNMADTKQRHRSGLTLSIS
jgi:hypothetical protein